MKNHTSKSSSSTGLKQTAHTTMHYSGAKGYYPNSKWKDANVKGTKFSSDSPMAANAHKGSHKKMGY